MTEKLQAQKGQWVEIHQVVLPAGQRAPQVPEETQRVPLEMRVKGFINHEAVMGEEVTITTVTGRRLKGTLIAIGPSYQHNFGEHVSELVTVGVELRALLAEAGKEEEVNG